MSVTTVLLDLVLLNSVIYDGIRDSFKSKPKIIGILTVSSM